MNGTVLKEAIKFGATEGAKRLVIFGLGAKELAIGVAIGVGAAIGGSKIGKAAKSGVNKMKENAKKIVEEAKKEKAEKDAQKK